MHNVRNFQEFLHESAEVVDFLTTLIVIALGLVLVWSGWLIGFAGGLPH